MPDTFANRLTIAMQIRNIRAAELAKLTGLSEARISQYVHGVYEAKQDGLYRLSSALNVSERWLMGYDVPMDEPSEEAATDHDRQQWEEQYNHNGALSVRSRILDEVTGAFGDGADRVLDHFDQLNDTGKKKAVEALEDLAAIDKYRKDG